MTGMRITIMGLSTPVRGTSTPYFVDVFLASAINSGMRFFGVLTGKTGGVIYELE